MYKYLAIGFVVGVVVLTLVMRFAPFNINTKVRMLAAGV